jgi:osmotically inducible protein OsmC
MTQLEKERTTQAPGRVIYTAKTHTTGGRENGASRSSDGRLDVKLSLPGSPRIGTNPEQLFAAGWSACFESAIGLAARQRKVTLPELTIDAEVDLHLADGEYSLSAPASIATSPGPWSRKRNTSVRTRRQRTATSTLRSTWFDGEQARSSWREGTCHDSGHIMTATAAKATGSWCREAHAKQNEVSLRLRLVKTGG